MFNITYAAERDKPFWFSLDRHLRESEFSLKVRDKRAYVIKDDDTPVGVMRYNLFWDTIPFLTLIYIEESRRGKGYGKKAMLHWEDEMRRMGYPFIMTSTDTDESTQHFYRKLGYKDCGCFIEVTNPDFRDMEMFLMKTLNTATTATP